MQSGHRLRLLALSWPHRAAFRCYSGGRNETRNKVFLVFPAICVGLGTWQIYRRQWKLDLIDQMQRKLSSQPIEIGESLAELAANAANYEYTPVRVTGEFDHSREQLIGPRHYVDPDDPGETKRQGSLMSAGNRVGFHVVTPLRLSDSGQWILANRGWVPSGHADPATRPQGQVSGEVTLRGLVRSQETSSWLAASGASRNRAASSERWHSRDVQGMSTQLNTCPLMIDCDAASTVDGGPIGGQTRVALRNEHLNYVITWYTLAGAMLLLWIFRVK